MIMVDTKIFVPSSWFESTTDLTATALGAKHRAILLLGDSIRSSQSVVPTAQEFLDLLALLTAKFSASDITRVLLAADDAPLCECHPVPCGFHSFLHFHAVSMAA
jgi:hypothetical protein